MLALPHVLGVVGGQVYVVRGGSMSPDIPIGSIVITDPVDPHSIAVGDVITFRVGNASVVTHRVTGISGGSQLSFDTKGDANNAADPVPVPADAILGRVEFSAPSVGLAMTILSTVGGLVVAFGILGALLIGGWFIDELEATVRRASSREAVEQVI
jgi:signal peptidase